MPEWSDYTLYILKHQFNSALFYQLKPLFKNSQYSFPVLLICLWNVDNFTVTFVKVISYRLNLSFIMETYTLMAAYNYNYIYKCTKMQSLLI